MNIVDRDTLEEEYCNQEKQMREIARDHNIAIGTVFNYMRKYGIPSRKSCTEVSRARLSAAFRGRPSKLKGRPISEEHKKNISAGKKGKFRKPSEFGGYRKKRCDGYISVFVPSHPYANKE